MTDNPQYAWRDATNTITSLMDKSSFVVLRSGIYGFSNITDERSKIPCAARTGELVTGRTGNAREFGFNLMIIGSSHSDLIEKRNKLLKIFTDPGRLYIQKGASQIYIDCYAARGSPEIRDGMAPDATTQTITLTLIAPDPYFYGNRITCTLSHGESTLTVINPGSAETPCTILLNAESATNTTTQQTMKSRAGMTITGTTVEISDNGVTATLDSRNVLDRFTCDSDFWSLAPGQNTMTGIEMISFRPRWMGV